ncbi:hypothetical protein V9T40_014338 [Parthenolecanium corni]|uniref:Paired amphipathic helix protein Sin3a n=1 Tax=Parthenolecanium corni TaxID=536013 RepID=A0AAN9T5P9_9HEMI
MKRRLDDNGTPAETLVNTFPPSLSPTRSRSISAISNLTNISYSPQITTSSPYPVDSTSPIHNFAAIMPTLTVHDKAPASSTISVGSAPHAGLHTIPIQHSIQIRNKVHSSVVSTSPGQASSQQFQRLKVEDALSYLDQVKYKFGAQPQVYNDFLDIMKEFKSQSIDTPGVITRVSNLFKGHPELIVGFNTFLPPGYKIEVQSSDSGGYSFQVSVSIPSPSSSTSTLVPSTQTVLHTTSISSISSTVTTTTASAYISAPLSIVNSPMVAKPLPLPSAVNVPPLSTPLTIPSPVTAAPPPVIPANSVLNNVVTTPSAVVPVPSTSPTQSTFTLNEAHQAVSQALIHVESSIANQPIPQNQPVEFNHAINYVNKIKNRFQGQPDKYKRFLEILHTYQKEQRTLKDTAMCVVGGKTLTEAEVYSQVAKLFENQEDLLAEFGQFLPDATSHQSGFSSVKVTSGAEIAFNSARKPSLIGAKSFNNAVLNNSASCVTPNVAVNNTSAPGSAPTPGSTAKFASNNVSSTTPTGASGLLKRSSSMSNSHSSVSMQPAVKKHKSPTLRDISLTEAGKYGTLNDFAFFDRIRKTIHNGEMYKNFLRCLVIYNNEIISEAELLQLTTPFLGAQPELLRWFKEFLGQTDAPCSTTNASSTTSLTASCNSGVTVKEEPFGAGSAKSSVHAQDSFLDSVSYNNVMRSENAIDIDYTTCRRIGASYCAVPDDFNPPKCSGRTELCREVLNDSWVSFPSWSEDSTFVSSRKTQYEEYIYRCEDERFELDVVIETNAATIRVFDGVQKKLARLSSEEVAKFRLDDCLGGTSPSIHQRAIRRIYGEKAVDIIEGLKKNPAASVPVVLKRLKAKEEEWREAQKGFNKIWREQNEKFYLKSLDHQGMNFKQNDMKYLRSKSLMNEIEALFDERQEQQAASAADENGANTAPAGPHLVLPYRDKSVLDDAANLLIHHVKRQTGIHKEDKQKIKSLIRQFIPDLFYHPRQELSDDEREELDEKALKKQPPEEGDDGDVELEKRSASSPECGGGDANGKDVSLDDVKLPVHAISCHPDEHYTLFYADNHWYLFLRLHQILCDRLSRMYERANIIAKQESYSRESSARKESAAISLRLKPKPEIEVEDYYPAMLDMVKNVLDGNMDSTTYEDTLREMFGIHAYIAFTLDKVVSHAVRQLQYLVTDDTCQDCYEMFVKERLKSATGGPCCSAYQRVHAEANYQKRIESLSMESCFRILIYKIDCKITIECLDTDSDNEDPQDNEKWNNVAEDESNRENFSEFNENSEKTES